MCPVLQSLFILVALCWTSLPHVNLCLVETNPSLDRILQMWSHKGQYKGRINSFDLTALLLLTQPTRYAVGCLCCKRHAADSCATCPPAPFCPWGMVKSCFLSSWLPACMGLVHPRCRTLPVLNSMRFLSGCFSSWPRSHRAADLPSSISASSPIWYPQEICGGGTLLTARMVEQRQTFLHPILILQRLHQRPLGPGTFEESPVSPAVVSLTS